MSNDAELLENLIDILDSSHIDDSKKLESKKLLESSSMMRNPENQAMERINELMQEMKDKVHGTSSDSEFDKLMGMLKSEYARLAEDKRAAEEGDHSDDVDSFLKNEMQTQLTPPE